MSSLFSLDKNNNFIYDINNKITFDFKNERLGLNYMGCKRDIAEPLLKEMFKIVPKAYNFIDLFGGGGSMSFYALQCGFNIFYNDFYKNIYRMMNFCINFDKKSIFDEKELKIYLTKEKYKELRNKIHDDLTDIELIKIIIYSFACNIQAHYAFNDERSKIYHLVNDYLFFDCKKSLKELKSIFSGYGYIFDEFQAKNYDLNKKWLVFFKIINSIKNAQENNKNILFFKDSLNIKREFEFYRKEIFNRLALIDKIIHFLRKIDKNRFKISNLSYSDFDLSGFKKDETIIYCDIPYKNTKKYQKKSFNHDLFYEWVEKNKDYHIFVSEYQSPLKKIFEIEKKCKMNSYNNNLLTIENLFYNKA